MTDEKYGVYAVSPEKLDGCENYLLTPSYALCYTSDPPKGALEITDFGALPDFAREWLLGSINRVKMRRLAMRSREERERAYEFLRAFEKELLIEKEKLAGGGKHDGG